MDHQLEPHDVQRQVEQREARERHERGRHHERDVDEEQVAEREAEVHEELPALGDRAHDRAEVVVEQHDRRDLARAAGRALAHGDAHVGRLQRRDVVHAVAGHRHDLAAPLERAHQGELLRGHGACDHVERARHRCRARARNASRPSPESTRGSAPPRPISRATARAVSG